MDTRDIQNFEIDYDYPTVAPGDTVKGMIRFEVVRETKFRRVTFKVIGRENTHFTESHSTGSGKSKRYTHFYGRRNFFKIGVTALGVPKHSNDREQQQWTGALVPGHYKFPFAFRLPVDLLPSMTIPYDKETGIQYFVKANVHHYSGFTKEVPFAVVPLMPASQLQCSAPFQSQVVKAPRSCCCCISRGTTNVTFEIDRTIVIFGKDTELNGSFSIDNSESKEPVDVVYVQLAQKFLYAGVEQFSEADVTNTRIGYNILSSTTIDTKISASKQGSQSFIFQLQLGRPASGIPFPCSFRGELVTTTYQLRIVCKETDGGEVLVEKELIAASAIADTTVSPYMLGFPAGRQPLLVQTETVVGTKVEKGTAPQFMYAPPSGTIPEMPIQVADVGPFQVSPPLNVYIPPQF